MRTISLLSSLKTAITRQLTTHKKLTNKRCGALKTSHVARQFSAFVAILQSKNKIKTTLCNVENNLESGVKSLRGRKFEAGAANKLKGYSIGNIRSRLM